MKGAKDAPSLLGDDPNMSLGSLVRRLVVDIRRRLISRIALINPKGGIVSVDVAAFVRQLILFDTCLLKTHRLSEFPFFLRSFGFDGTLEILSSDALEIMWSPFTIAVDFHRNGKRSLPLFHFDCGAVNTADAEEYIHGCLKPFHDLTDISHKRILRLKKLVLSRFVNPPKDFETNVLAQIKSELRGKSPGIKSAVRLRLPRVHPQARVSDFDLEFEEVPNVGFRAHADLASRAGISDQEAHGVLQAAFAGLANLDHRVGEMRGYEALSGFSEEEIAVFTDKCDFLMKEMNPQLLERSFERVLEIVGFPDPVVDSSTRVGQISKLLKVRQTDECKEFRAWLSTVHNASDAEIRERVTGVRAKVAEFLHSSSGRTVRVLTAAGIGLIPHFGIPAGLAVGFGDAFLIDKILPHSGVVSFLSNLYPSIFDKA